MKKFFLVGLLMIVCFCLTFGQRSSDSIKIKKTFGGYQFYQSDQKLKLSRLVKTMRIIEQAYKEIKSAKPLYTLSSICAGAGGGLFVLSFSGDKPNWTLAGVSVGFIAVSFPIYHKFVKRAAVAVNTYNEGLQATSFWDKTEIELVLSSNKIGISINFK